MNGSISRRDAINAICDACDTVTAACPHYPCKRFLAIESLPSAQTDLIAKMQNGIKATDADDTYSCGMRNGMRWCISLLNEKEPMYENCPSEQPEIIRCKDCKYWHREIHNGVEYFNFSSCDLNHHGDGNIFYCADAERKEE